MLASQTGEVRGRVPDGEETAAGQIASGEAEEALVVSGVGAYMVAAGDEQEGGVDILPCGTTNAEPG